MFNPRDSSIPHIVRDASLLPPSQPTYTEYRRKQDTTPFQKPITRPPPRPDSPDMQERKSRFRQAFYCPGDGERIESQAQLIVEWYDLHPEKTVGIPLANEDYGDVVLLPATQQRDAEHRIPRLPLSHDSFQRNYHLSHPSSAKTREAPWAINAAQSLSSRLSSDIASSFDTSATRCDQDEGWKSSDNTLAGLTRRITALQTSQVMKASMMTDTKSETGSRSSHGSWVRNTCSHSGSSAVFHVSGQHAPLAVAGYQALPNSHEVSKCPERIAQEVQDHGSEAEGEDSDHSRSRTLRVHHRFARKIQVIQACRDTWTYWIKLKSVLPESLVRCPYRHRLSWMVEWNGPCMESFDTVDACLEHVGGVHSQIGGEMPAVTAQPDHTKFPPAEKGKDIQRMDCLLLGLHGEHGNKEDGCCGSGCAVCASTSEDGYEEGARVSMGMAM
ncbi:hypothetical protein CALCODRAFT_500765 [Calocera cornea HHB12733]|uniref:Uncharacterized protein n=1 Tax=Calocera cornea HHB12733 TaxID=1353952 RepID=A0A165DX91_9BASI|nr:hypothetical protein CALCODRAFT_500765 [Calocera cornea HHB12733]